jgi:hypothetical protein
MNYFKKGLAKIEAINNSRSSKRFANNPIFIEGKRKNKIERSKPTSRTEVLNFLLSQFNRETSYLEIGVRNPADNHIHINANIKYSVDPGVKAIDNPAHFGIPSDEFFAKLRNREILSNNLKFDVVFVDGLHLADQVDRDIINSLEFIKEDGFIVLHDCNPPSIWHAREDYHYWDTPAEEAWNGSTWKAFLKWRGNASVQSCCIDSDWGVGVLSKKYSIGKSIDPVNPFYEYNDLDKNRQVYLNLVEYYDFKRLIEEQFSTTTK